MRRVLLDDPLGLRSTVILQGRNTSFSGSF